MSAAIIFHEVPPEIKGAIEPHLKRYSTIIPGWCAELIVRWNDTCTDSALRCDVRPEYRDCILEVCPGWLEMPERSREGCVIHELCHIIAAPLVNFSRDTIHSLTEEGTPLRSILDQQCENAFESVVEDQARAFHKLFQKLATAPAKARAA